MSDSYVLRDPSYKALQVKEEMVPKDYSHLRESQFPGERQVVGYLQPVEVGTWIVQDPFGNVSYFTDEQFKSMFREQEWWKDGA